MIQPKYRQNQNDNSAQFFDNFGAGSSGNIYQNQHQISSGYEQNDNLGAAVGVQK